MPDEDWTRSAVEKKGGLHILGPLETEIMQIIWKRNKAPTGQVYEDLRKDRNLALTTVSGTLNRLYEKGLLHREIAKGKRGLTYVYAPKMNEEKFKRFVAEKVTHQLLKEYEGPMVSALINSLAKNPQKLEELRRKIDALLKERMGKTL